jgi:hypothetical protein
MGLGMHIFMVIAARHWGQRLFGERGGTAAETGFPCAERVLERFSN